MPSLHTKNHFLFRLLLPKGTQKYVFRILILFSLMMQHSVFLRRWNIKKRNLLTSVILDCRIVCLHPLKYLMFVEEKCNDKKSSSFDWHMLTDILWYDDFGSAPQINLTQIFVFAKCITDMNAPSWYIYLLVSIASIIHTSRRTMMRIIDSILLVVAHW